MAQRSREQLIEEMRKRCEELLNVIVEMRNELFPRVMCTPYARYLFDRYYDDGIIWTLDEQSIRRIMEACDQKMTLAEFVPSLNEMLTRERLEGLKRMRLGEFIKLWRNIRKELRRLRKEYVIEDIGYHMGQYSRLVDVLKEEIIREKIKRGYSEERAKESVEYSCP